MTEKTITTLREELAVTVEFQRQHTAMPEEFVYHGLYDLILQEGEEFTPASYDEEKYGPRGRERECFKNAAELALWDDGLTYVEGYGWGFMPGLAAHHAWCVDEEGQVVDPTWQDAHAYLGLRITDGDLRRVLLATETYGVLDRWQDRWPELKRKWDGRLP
jgi:hypothetical protein